MNNTLKSFQYRPQHFLGSTYEEHQQMGISEVSSQARSRMYARISEMNL